MLLSPSFRLTMNQSALLMPSGEATKSAEPFRTPAALLAQRAQQAPETLALVMGKEQISFGELEVRASQLAHCLRSRGAISGVVVGLCLPRSPQFVVAALAIMKCGAAYLPLDPAHPAERLRFALEDSGAAVLITEENLAAHFAGLQIQSIQLDRDKAEIAQQSTASPELATNPDDLAYVIYTSGSTGQPKGVEITQRNLSNLDRVALARFWDRLRNSRHFSGRRRLRRRGLGNLADPGSGRCAVFTRSRDATFGGGVARLARWKSHHDQFRFHGHG